MLWLIRSAAASLRRPRHGVVTLIAALAAVLAAGCQTVADEGAPRASLAGQLLVASEMMDDPHFAETIIYMIEHDAGGAMGLIVNVPLARLPIRALLTRFGHDPADARGELPVYYGGPVDRGRGFFLHTTDVMLADSVRVSDDLALTGRPEILRALGAGKGPEHGLFMLGYAGWGAGQLEREVAQNAWFVLPAETSLLFTERPERSWHRALELRGIEL